MKADPGRDGADVAPRIRLRVLIVEDSSDDALLLLRELEKGGFEPEYERVDTPENMRRALAGKEPWDVVLSDWRMPRFSATEALTEPLTERETEVLELLARGKANKQIARELFVAMSTVKTHVNNLYRKLGVGSRTQAALYAARIGLVSTEQIGEESR